MKQTPLRRRLTLWVVEMWMDGVDRWEPTTGVALTQAEAHVVMRGWKTANWDDTFRVSPYMRVRP